MILKNMNKFRFFKLFIKSFFTKKIIVRYDLLLETIYFFEGGSISKIKLDKFLKKSPRNKDENKVYDFILRGVLTEIKLTINN